VAKASAKESESDSEKAPRENDRRGLGMERSLERRLKEKAGRKKALSARPRA
jgi:hypothetical protein